MSENRRGFLAAAGGTVIGAASARLAAAAGKPPLKRTRGVVIGVQSYSFRDKPLDDAVAAMAGLGLATCELWQGHLEPRLTAKGASDADKAAFREKLRAWRLETPLSFFEAVAKKFDAAGVPLCAYNYSFKNDFSDQEIERGFAMARALGVTTITASAQQGVVARVAPLARKHKVTVAMHNHSIVDPEEFATPADFEKAMKGPGRERIAVNLDVGHFTAANFDAVAFLTKHHARIVTLHIKDRKKDQGAVVPFGEGDAPLAAVLKLLRTRRWNIPANIEYEYPGTDSVAEVKRCLEFCQRALTD